MHTLGQAQVFQNAPWEEQIKVPSLGPPGALCSMWMSIPPTTCNLNQQENGNAGLLHVRSLLQIMFSMETELTG